jgi:hypothetical protein
VNDPSAAQTANDRFVEELYVFLDRLRTDGYLIGVAETVAVQRVLLAVAAKDCLRKVADLKSCLGPVVCSNSDQQEDFSQRFDAWVVRYGQPKVDDGGKTPTATAPVVQGRTVAALDRLFAWVVRWHRVLLLSIPATMIILSFFLISQIEWVNEGVLRGQLIRAGLIGFFLVGLGASVLYSQEVSSRLAGFLKRFRRGGLSLRVMPADAPRFRLVMRPPAEPASGAKGAAGLAAAFRMRYEVPGGVDVAATIDRAVRRAGPFALVAGLRRVEPEYLALIERVHLRDHQARFMHRLLDVLEARGVAIDRYEFRADARRAFRVDPRREFRVDPRAPMPPAGSRSRPRTIEDLLGAHPDHRLLILCDGEVLTDPRTLGPCDWIGVLEGWARRALLTPVPRPAWSVREQMLVDQGFVVAPADSRGMSELMARFRGEPEHPARAETARPYPDDLRDNPSDWLDRDAPDRTRVDRMLRDLRWYLGDDGYRWFCACALYPALEWGLTLDLGDRLKTRGFEPLRDDAVLAAIVRLPWFRQGEMPDWLRNRLVRFEQPRSSVDQARRAVQSALSEVVGLTARGDALEIVRDDKGRLQASARDEFRTVIERQPADSLLRDPLYAAVVLGDDLSPPRTLPAPEPLERWSRLGDQTDPAAEKPPNDRGFWLWRYLFELYSGGPLIEFDAVEGSSRLIVLAGMSKEHLMALRDRLRADFPEAGVLTLRWLFSSRRNLDETAGAWRDALVEHWTKRRGGSDSRFSGYEDVTLIGFDVAILPLRRCFFELTQKPDTAPVSAQVKRIFSVSGYNRGWGRRANSTKVENWLLEVGLSSYAAVGLFRAMNSTRRGCPEVVDLNVHWVRDLLRTAPTEFPATVQLVEARQESGRPLADLLKVRNPPGVAPCLTVPIEPSAKPEELAILIADLFKREEHFPSPRNDSDQDLRVERVVLVLDWGPIGVGMEPASKRLVAVARERKVNVIVNEVPDPSHVRLRLYPFGTLSFPAPDSALREFMDQYAEAVARFPKAAVSVIADRSALDFLERALTRYHSFSIDRLAILRKAPGTAADASTRLFEHNTGAFYFEKYDKINECIVFGTLIGHFFARSYFFRARNEGVTSVTTSDPFDWVVTGYRE